MGSVATCSFNPAYIGPREDIQKLVPMGTESVLDLGCSVGALGAALKTSGRAQRVVGVELDVAMATAARDVLDCVQVADLSRTRLPELFPGERFDCVVCADVLEHLINPWETLADATELLTNRGVVIACIPNVRHYSTIVSLVLRRHWPYRDRGIHDRTHLRFFTLRNIRELFEGAGLEITSCDRNYRIIERPHRCNAASRWVAVPGIRDLLTFQFVVTGRRRREEGSHLI